VSDKRLVPERFGPLTNLRIVTTGVLIAAPFATELAAEMGAEVILIERPGTGDEWRILGLRLPTKNGAQISTNWVQERRNIFCVTLDISKPQGREIFLKLIDSADVWLENSKGETYQKLGIDDEQALRRNQRLVITHVSGYGQTGLPGYIRRASYDPVCQAFGGSMYQTGFPDSPPSLAQPFTADYLTALFALWSSLAGVLSARETGRGQVIDLAQYEAVHRVLGGTMVEYFQQHVIRERHGNRGLAIQPLGSYEASDGWLVIVAASPAGLPRLLEVLGLDPDDPKWVFASKNVESIEGIEFDAIFRGWVNERTVAEVNRLLNEAQVACSPVMNSRDMAEDAQYQARAMHVEWEDGQAGTVRGIGIVPKFSRTPGKIWRGAVGLGHDNELVYGKLLGLTAEELATLKSSRVI
jgi:crotonobetainyl-CoA:carnitine CoA-transferase CaiB-like acyl-CoA transferase